MGSARSSAVGSTVQLILRVALLVSGAVFGLLAWTLLAYATTGLLVSGLSLWGGVIYGCAFLIEVIAVGWVAISRARSPRWELATALGVAGWICAMVTLVFINVLHATL